MVGLLLAVPVLLAALGRVSLASRAMARAGESPLPPSQRLMPHSAPRFWGGVLGMVYSRKSSVL